MDDGTIGYYDSDPEGYSERTSGRDMAVQRGMFVSYLPEGGRILDLGCGSGRDSAAMMRMGFDVVPVDGSEGMCRVASENIGVPVRHLLFDELDYDGEFDGVWACASLLHVPSHDLRHILSLVRRSLRDGGVLFVCFKKGSFEGYRDGRWYTDMDLPGLEALVRSAGLMPVKMWEAGDVDGTVWVNALARRVRGARGPSSVLGFSELHELVLA